MNDLIEKYIQLGLDYETGCDNMVVISQDVMEKVNIISKLSNRTPEEVINETLWDQLRKVEDVPEKIDYDKVWNMLEHDNPEGDDILENLRNTNELLRD